MGRNIEIWFSKDKKDAYFKWLDYLSILSYTGANFVLWKLRPGQKKVHNFLH